MNFFFYHLDQANSVVTEGHLALRVAMISWNANITS